MFKKNKKQEETVQERPDFTAKNNELYTQLTNKNADYFSRLNRELEKLGVSDQDREEHLYVHLKEALANQSSGETARRLFGTPTERADYIVNGDPAEEIPEGYVELSPDWQIYADGALLIGGIFAIISGMMDSNPMGLISFIFNYLIGGVVVLAIVKTIPRPGNNSSYLKYFGASIGSIVLWALVASMINILIPDFINFTLPQSFLIIAGTVSLVGKWLFKRHYNVQGGLF